MQAYDHDRFTPPAPLANVTIRHPEKGNVISDVPMLVDSGADVTLIPLASVILVGVTIESGDGYQLMGFDGSMSVAKAVQLDLLFLTRTFKGRFLVIDQEWGILGRDILNHLVILLHGPHLAWDEHLENAN